MQSLNCSIVKVAAGNATVPARFYIGMVLVGGSAASTAKVYAGDANSDPEVGAACCAANEADHDDPTCPTPLDHGVPKDSLYIVVTGTGAYALVRYSN